jgi:hypothetical protein
MLRAIAISTLIFAGVSAVAYADVYRWVDEHGTVHYTDRWVPGSELIKSNKPHPNGADSDSPRQNGGQAKYAASGDRASAQVQQESAERAVKQDMAKVREQRCKEAKDRYDKAIAARRIFKSTPADKSKDTDRPDDRQYLSDEEADAYRVKARSDVQEACGSVPPQQ